MKSNSRLLVVELNQIKYRVHQHYTSLCSSRPKIRFHRNQRFEKNNILKSWNRLAAVVLMIFWNIVPVVHHQHQSSQLINSRSPKIIPCMEKTAVNWRMKVSRFYSRIKKPWSKVNWFLDLVRNPAACIFEIESIQVQYCLLDLFYCGSRLIYDPDYDPLATDRYPFTSYIMRLLWSWVLYNW